MELKSAKIYMHSTEKKARRTTIAVQVTALLSLQLQESTSTHGTIVGLYTIPVHILWVYSLYNYWGGSAIK